MKYSIKEQIGAVNWARKVVKQVVPTEKKLEQLNDAASTLSALNFIGQDIVLIAPELIQEVKKLIQAWDVSETIDAHMFKIVEIINRLPK